MAISAWSSAEQIVGNGHLSTPPDPLQQQPAHPWLPLPWLVETVRDGEGNQGRVACGWRRLVPCGWRRQQPWEDRECWVHKPGRWCSGSSARVRLLVGLKPKSWPSRLCGYKPCSALLTGGVPIPSEETPKQPREAPSRRHRCDRFFERFFFFPQESTKKGNKKRLPSWLRFAPEGCFLPAALILCCNTGNLLLLTPGVVSNSQMVLTSVSCNWWPTCLTL